MKLLTTLKPRGDGTIIVRDSKGAPIVFAPDGSGDLVAEVADTGLVATLLATENFEPADESDYQEAEALLGAARDAGADDGDGDDGDDDVNFDAPPAEANTPPLQPTSVPSRRKKAN